MSATAETANVAAAVVSDALHNGPPIKTSAGFSPTFWAIVSGILVQIGIVVRIWIKGMPERAQRANEGEKQVMDTLLSEINSLRTRVTEVEKQVVDERASCAKQISELTLHHSGEMTAMRDHHRREMDELRGELKGMRETAIQHARSSNALLEVGRRIAPEATLRLEKGDD